MIITLWLFRLFRRSGGDLLLRHRLLGFECTRQRERGNLLRLFNSTLVSASNKYFIAVTDNVKASTFARLFP
jgi:hypothetical protein